ncbi:protein DEHYDRATION-INDUCED 19 homolog 4-like isoform X2 [Cornus florida]|uniref:protein DEHYDRATION-INDUCED 19 homolog 4-like isoform X2 n=1 Tax=Cornus florida TaxID=4283 RepID=UPI00289770DC|nr:protein DEHYDRATION-INDUCED 19 homolog 4-like isoform X2 [Cornus florida]
MDDDMWNSGFSISTDHTTPERSSDYEIDVVNIEDDDDDDEKSELVCPFCLDDFDLVGLCYHMDDDHHTDVISGICPVCDAKVGTNAVGHIITKHANILRAMHKKKLNYGESHSILSLLRKELQDEHLQFLLEGSSSVVASSNMAPDPLLSSFLYNPTPADEPENIQPNLSTEESMGEKSLDDSVLERNIHPSPLLDKDQEEKAQRCEFVRGLLFSTILDDDL